MPAEFWQALSGAGSSSAPPLATTKNCEAPPSTFLDSGHRWVCSWPDGVAWRCSPRHPFDNWWHNAYGLDVKIVSPPHTLLILGIRAISVGMMFLILAAMNRAAEAGTADFKSLQRLFLYLGGLAVGGQMFFLQQFTFDVVLHRAVAYIAMGIALPILFATISQASRFRWAATATASIYMLFIISEILILPLFPAQPKLGPVFNPVTHLVPAQVPDSPDRPCVRTGSALAASAVLEAVADCDCVRRAVHCRAGRC